MIAGAAHEHDDAAGHVLAEEVARVPADDDDRALPAVLLHVDAAAPAAAVAHDELAAAHGVAGRIAHAPVHHYGAGVHGVGGLVLGASEHLHLAAVHVAGQIVARGSVNFQALARGQGAAQVTLGVGLHDADGVGFGKGRAYSGVGLLEVFRSQFHDNGFSHAITLPRTSRRGFPVPSRSGPRRAASAGCRAESRWR